MELAPIHDPTYPTSQEGHPGSCPLIALEKWLPTEQPESKTGLSPDNGPDRPQHFSLQAIIPDLTLKRF